MISFANSSTSTTVRPPVQRLVWIITVVLVAIGLAAVTRRAYVLLFPPNMSSQFAASRFGAAAALDTGFALHQTLVFLHIIPAFLFMSLIPFSSSSKPFVGSTSRGIAGPGGF